MYATALNELINREKGAGRIAGPYVSPPYPNLVLSPLGMVPKKEPGKFRMIHDLSFPQHKSVNDSIADEQASVSYETLDRVVELVQTVGRHALLAKVDIENAFRIIPVAPADRHLLGFKVDDLFYFDKCLPMGCRSSCAIFESFSNAVQWVAINKLNIPFVTHILDDFILISPNDPAAADLNLSAFLQFCDQCKIPIKHSKTVRPATKIIAHGIEVDTIQMQTRLPEDKLLNARNLLRNYCKKRSITLTNLQSIIGFLNFACRVVTPGRAFLRRLINLTIGITQKHHHITLNAEARADMQAWLLFLESFNGVSMFIQNSWAHSDVIKMYSDASGAIGYAAVFGSRWFAGGWSEQWTDRSITTKELYPIVLGLEIWGHMLRNHRVLFKTDNAAVAAIINKQSCREHVTMALVRRLVLVSLKFNIMFKAVHIPGSTNIIPDKLSRFLFQEAHSLAPWLAKEPTSIPPNLLTT